MVSRKEELRRVLTSAFVLGVALSCACAGERVIFSNPETPSIVPQAQRASNIPEPSREIRGFGISPPQPEMPYVPPPAPVRPSEKKKTEKRSIYDEPAIFSDKQSDQQNQNEDPLKSFYGKSAMGSSAQPFSSPWLDPARRLDQDRALSPVRQFDWSPAPSGSSQRSRDDKTAVRWQDRQDRPDEAGIFAPRQQDVEREVGGFFGFLRPGVKRELTPEQLDRKSEFEKLMNPTFAPLARTPVAPKPDASPLDAVNAPSPFLAPAPVPQRRSLDPMESYNERLRALRGPTADDLNRKVFGVAAVPPQRPPETGKPRKPLNAQPSFHEIPSRQF